jgi:hypothetical protein
VTVAVGGRVEAGLGLGEGLGVVVVTGGGTLVPLPPPPQPASNVTATSKASTRDAERCDTVSPLPLGGYESGGKRFRPAA